MWPFLNKRKTSDTMLGNLKTVRETRPRPMQFAEIVESMGDFSALKEHDIALKFWLPEPAVEALKELSDRNGDSLSSALRQLFALHCYGIYAFHVMNEAIPGLFEDPASPLYSRMGIEEPPGKKRVDTYWVPELGKNVVSIKVWISSRMRRDLQALADHVNLKLSQYVREIVISRLLGHGTLPYRPEMLKAAPLPSAEEWCEGREVKMRQVVRDEYFRHAEGESRTEWVDK